MPTALTRFLDVGLLQIGDDDQKLALLEAASAEIATKIDGDLALAGRIYLVALDPSASDADAVHELAATTLAAHWKTLANKVGAKPVQIQRAVLLRAIELAAEKTPVLAGILPNLCRHGPRSDDTAATVFASVIADFKRTSTENLKADWIDKIPVPTAKTQTKPKKLPPRDELVLGIFRATGPVIDREGKPVANTNPHWPASNQTWASEFSTRMTEAFLTILTAAQQGLREELLEAVRELTVQTQEVVRRATVRDAKAELLWLRMSEFSPSKLQSYRTLSAGELAIHAALDVSAAVPGVAPQSVFNFLRTLVDLVDREPRPVKLYISSIQQALGKTPSVFDRLICKTLPQSGRRTWIEYAMQPGDGTVSSDLGELESTTLTPSECAIQLLGELQLAKVLQET